MHRTEPWRAQAGQPRREGVPSLPRATPLVVVALMLAACGSPVLLAVDVRTDLAPGLEFDEVRTTMDGAAAPTRAVSFNDPFASGARVSEFEGVSPGRRQVRVELRRAGAVVLRRNVIVRLQGNLILRVLLTRDCRGVSCPGDGSAGATECLGSRCVEPECSPETPAACPTPACASDAECGAAAGCVVPMCVEGVCTQTPDSARCAADQVCSPDEGCVARPGVAGDAGVMEIDAGPPEPMAPLCRAPVAAVDTSRPDHVVGTGTAASCTEAALAEAVALGGIITFDCGGDITLPITRTLVAPIDRDTTIDGGGRVTLDGGDATQILAYRGTNYRRGTHVLTLQHLTFVRGRATGTRPYAPAPAPCSQGSYDGSGGAVEVVDGTLHVFDSTFLDNRAESLGPDVGGGAISLASALGSVVVGSTFRGNRASNGGAIRALQADLDVYDTIFENNVAEGHDGTAADAMQCMVLAESGGYHIGSGGNGGAVHINGNSDPSHTLCAVTFRGNVGGSGAFGGGFYRTGSAAGAVTTFDRCRFEANTGQSGVGAYVQFGDLEVLSSTFDGNVAAGGGGGLESNAMRRVHLENDTFERNVSTRGLGGAFFLGGGTGEIAFCTFSDNRSDGGGGYFGAAIGGGATLTIRGCLFSSNTSRDGGSPMQCHSNGTGEGNVQWPRARVVGGGDDGLCTPTTLFADPRLGPLGDHGGSTPTRLPSVGSPALGRGVGCPAFDQRGRARPETGCTSGAVEGSE